jgi:hypothetical protein
MCTLTIFTSTGSSDVTKHREESKMGEKMKKAG